MQIPFMGIQRLGETRDQRLRSWALFPPHEKRCDNCEHWWIATDHDSAEPQEGFCKRYPPVIDFRKKQSNVGVFPVTLASDTCGEWLEHEWYKPVPSFHKKLSDGFPDARDENQNAVLKAMRKLDRGNHGVDLETLKRYVIKRMKVRSTYCHWAIEELVVMNAIEARESHGGEIHLRLTKFDGYDIPLSREEVHEMDMLSSDD